MKKLALIILLLITIFPVSAFAQEESRAVISTPDLSKFPYISTTLKIHAMDGSFIRGLTSDNVTMLEDGNSAPVVDLQEKRVGLQITVAINTAPSFANRNTLGISRYQYLVEYLNLWADKQKEITLDDLSLITNSGTRQIHMKDIPAWRRAFISFQPDLKATAPSADLLGQAVDLALGYASNTPVEKAILYITPLPDTELGTVVRDVVARANQANAHIFVWMISSKNQYTDPKAEELRQLAIQTGGQFIAFSGTEEMPPISSLLEPFRSMYQITYKSAINQSGEHNLAGQVRLSQEMVTSLPVPFNITIQPPNPIFIDLPTQIIRSTTVTDNTQRDFLTPPNQPVDILVEFTDGHNRSLASSTLLVDGQIVSKNIKEPFERFSWDLSRYKTDEKHILQVEVTDELGLTNRSSEFPVEVVIVLPAINRWADFMDGGGIYLLLGAIFAAGVLSTVLYISWRKRAKKDVEHISPVSSKDPITQPVKIRQEKAKQKKKFGRSVQISGIKTATLVQVNRDSDTILGYDVPLGERKFTIGSDRLIADVVINAEGVEPRHALIWPDHQGNYFVSNAIPGVTTVVNENPVPEDGILLQQGDLIKIGSILYRYQEYPGR